MTNMSDIFIFIIGSFEDRAYKYFVKMRKLQLAKYNIPHKFLFDGPCPIDYTPDSNDIFYDKPQPPFPIDDIPNPELNPHMIVKFLKAIKSTDFDPSKYKYILRINLSTFINFPKLFEFLPKMPTSNGCAAYSVMFSSHIWPDYDNKLFTLVSGTAQIFTPDFISWLRENIQLDDPDIYKHNDDVVISHFVNKQNLKIIPLHLNYDRNDTNSILIRLKHETNRMYDVESWSNLMRRIDGITFAP